MKKKVVTCIMVVLTAMYFNTAITASAAGSQDNLTDTTMDTEYIQDAAGSGQNDSAGWQEIEGTKYYFPPETGTMATGWQEIEDAKYYFSPETGAMATGWQEIEGAKYYFSPETGAMATGWQEIEGAKYYFSPETGSMAAGWQKIEDAKYYFSPETGAMATGWQEIEGAKYYFSPKTGSMFQGRKNIKGKAYFFGENGVLQIDGWVKNGDKTYYCKPNGVLASGWIKIQGHKYYFNPKNNRMVTGSHKVGESYYIFQNNGKLANTNGIKIVTVKGQVYCAGPDGKAAGGWQILNKKLYYATKKGLVKKNEVYQGITFSKTGAAVENTASKLKIKLMQIVGSITNDSMSKSAKLAACWDYVTKKGNFHYASKYPNFNVSTWPRDTAYNMLETHSGNCYSFACAFAALAHEIGYKPYVVCGRIHGTRDGAGDGYTRHAWVMIDKKYYDPEAQCAGIVRGIYASSIYPMSHKIQQIVAYSEASTKQKAAVQYSDRYKKW